MGDVAESVWIDSSLQEVWDAYFNPDTWPSWVDGFSDVISSQGYPERGGTLRWRSIPAGRGEVTEEVLEHEPPRLHRIRFSDPESEGSTTASFEISGEGVDVTQAMSYRIRHPGIFGPFTDILFVRRQVAASLARSLERFKYEIESDA
jgi:uncharacterized protein YndB with AHSA1/START domain